MVCFLEALLLKPLDELVLDLALLPARSPYILRLSVLGLYLPELKHL
jgi:hypothetical protein